MRATLLVIVLLELGCAELRFPSRTEMVETAPDPALVAQPARSETAMRRGASSTANHSRGLVIGGAIAALVGLPFLIGGIVGLQKQEAANAAADAQCIAQQGWFCGLFDNLSYIPYGGLIGFGGVAMATGVVLLGVSASRSDRERIQRP